MAGYTYESYVTALRVMVASQDPDVDFDTILPSIIDYAEQRIYRELNLISTVQTDTTTALTPGARGAAIPNSFVVVNGINLLPADYPTSDTRTQLVPVSRDVLDVLWPSTALATRSAPAMFAMITQWNIIVGPCPDAAYVLEVIGTYRPAPLSASTPVTFLSQYLPDLFMAASMIFASGYMRNFSSSGSDPQMPVNWQQQYQELMTSANAEELRKKFLGVVMVLAAELDRRSTVARLSHAIVHDHAGRWDE